METTSHAQQKGRHQFSSMTNHRHSNNTSIDRLDPARKIQLWTSRSATDWGDDVASSNVWYIYLISSLNFLFLRMFLLSVSFVVPLCNVTSLISQRFQPSHSLWWFRTNEPDRGLEFANKLFQRYFKKKQIHFLTVRNQETESSITEQLIRTLWTRIWRYFTFKDTERHVDLSQHVISEIWN